MNEEERITRRAFFREVPKKVVQAAALTTAVGLGIKEGEQFVDRWIDVDAGGYYPLYEVHTTGINLDLVPDEVDVLYREGVFRDEDTIFNPCIYPAEILRDILKEQSRTLFENGMPILWGDCALPPSDAYAEDFLKSFIDEWTVGGLVLFSFDKLTGVYNTFNPEKSIKRRAFMRLMSKIGLVLAGRALIPLPFMTANAVSANVDAYYHHPLQRVVQRLQALSNHLQFDEYTIFYRNVYMAHKLLLSGYKYRPNQGQKTRFAYQVGAMHSGIEDFLMLGIDFCRWLLVNLPGKDLDFIVDYNSGAETFATAKMIQKDGDDGVVEKVFVDEKLVEMIDQSISQSGSE